MPELIIEGVPEQSQVRQYRRPGVVGLLQPGLHREDLWWSGRVRRHLQDRPVPHGSDLQLGQVRGAAAAHQLPLRAEGGGQQLRTDVRRWRDAVRLQRLLRRRQLL